VTRAQVQFHDMTVMRKRVSLLSDYFGFFGGTRLWRRLRVRECTCA
jgi:hypothetical protein